MTRYTLTRDALARLLDGQDLVAMVGQLLAEQSRDHAGDVEQPRGKFFSTFEEQVVQLLGNAPGPLSRPAIATALRLSRFGLIRGLLANLVERDVLVRRRVLESSSKKGYALALPDDQKPDDFRAGVLAWIEAQPVPEDDGRPVGRTSNDRLSDSDLAERIAEAQKARACQCGLD